MGLANAYLYGSEIRSRRGTVFVNHTTKSIVVGETHSPRPHLAPQDPIFFDQIRDRSPLPAVQPGDEHAQHNLEHGWVDHEAELISQVRQTSAELRNTTGFGKHVAQDGKYPARNGLPPEAAKDFINRLPGMAGGGQFLRILRFLFVPATRPRPAPNRLVGFMFS